MPLLNLKSATQSLCI